MPRSYIGNAKTIDLCNNPLTKEPKLSAAVRIAPEWVGYDDQIRELLELDLKQAEKNVQVEETIVGQTDKTEPKEEL